MQSDLERFYELLGWLKRDAAQGRALKECTAAGYPPRGVYFFREPGEFRRGGQTPRIVRVGTHAVSTGSSSTLWGRLRAHRGSGDGRGNHRGSIFRLHLGHALLQRDREHLADLPSWGAGASAPREVREVEVEHERRVSAYLGEMSVLWLGIADAPGPRSLRGYVERNAIALLSNRLCPLDPPGPEWLGRHSPRAAIRESGLWNLNHVDESYEPAFLETMARLVEQHLRDTAPEMPALSRRGGAPPGPPHGG